MISFRVSKAILYAGGVQGTLKENRHFLWSLSRKTDPWKEWATFAEINIVFFPVWLLKGIDSAEIISKRRQVDSLFSMTQVANNLLGRRPNPQVASQSFLSLGSGVEKSRTIFFAKPIPFGLSRLPFVISMRFPAVLLRGLGASWTTDFEKAHFNSQPCLALACM